MNNFWRIVCLAVFVTGAVFLLITLNRVDAGYASAYPQLDFSDAEPARSFVVTFVEKSVAQNGIIKETGSVTRYVKADGEWRAEIKQNGRSDSTVYVGTQEGVFEKEKALADAPAIRRYVSPSSDRNILRLYRSANYLRNLPGFVRTDEVAGLTVYVFRKYMDLDSTEEWLEKSYSPKTGLTMLKIVSHMRDGSETLREAVSIEFKDLPDSLNQDVKNLPIRQTEKNQ